MLRKAGIAMAVAASAAALTALPAHAAKPVVTGHEALTHGMSVRDVHAAKAARPTRSSNLVSHGGSIQTAPKVYIILWGTQWTDPANDTGGVQALQVDFFSHVGFTANAGGTGDQWSSSTTQYCQGISSGSICPSGATFAGQPGHGAFVRTYADTSIVPTSPTQSNIAAVAAKAATAIGDFSSGAQYIVDTPSGHSMNGFKTQWCAWHSSTSANGNPISYTYMPYLPDAGSSCGANFNWSASASHSSLENSTNEGITIVGGHEYAESVTDPFPNSGWLDSSGAENGDKCAWASTTKAVSIDGVGYEVQPLWSNNANGGAGGCVTSYLNAGSQSS